MAPGHVMTVLKQLWWENLSRDAQVLALKILPVDRDGIRNPVSACVFFTDWFFRRKFIV